MRHRRTVANSCRPARNKVNKHNEKYGGGSRIRTHGALTRPTVFKTAAFGRSAIPPFHLFYRLAIPFARSDARSASTRGGREAGRCVKAMANLSIKDLQSPLTRRV